MDEDTQDDHVQSKAKVQTISTKRVFRIKLPTRKQWAWTGICVALLLFAGAVYVLTSYNRQYYLAKFTNDPVVFKIGNTAYHKSQIAPLTAYPRTVQGETYAAALKTVYMYMKTKEAIIQAGYTPTNGELNNAIISQDLTGASDPAIQKYLAYLKQQGKSTPSLSPLRTFKDSNYGAYLKLAAYTYIANEKVNNPIYGAYKGYAFIFNFGQNMIHTYGYSPKNYNDAAVIKSNKAYAQQKAQQIHQALLKKSISPAAAIQEIVHDPKVCNGFTTGDNNSTQFGNSTKVSWQNQVLSQSAVTYINSQSKSGISSIMEGTTPLVNVPQSAKDYGKTYFFFVDITKAQPANTGLGKKIQSSESTQRAVFYGA